MSPRTLPFARSNLEGSVVVVTGASSGIGRAAAHAFAEAGARLVLAARRSEGIEDARRECEARGADAVAVATDVAEEAQVLALAEAAVTRFGGIDVWVNNAAVSLFGRFEETPSEDFERVLRTNLFGYVHGARAAIRQFRRQGRGVLINVGSVVSKTCQPYTSAYVTSKFAIRGLSGCLRMELADAPNVHVCTLLPAAVDTPIFAAAANYTGRVARPIEPVYPPELVARDIVALARSPKRELVSGSAGQALALLATLAPGLAEKIIADTVERKHFAEDAAAPGSGNLHRPLDGQARVHGGWRRLQQGRVRRVGMLGTLAVAATALALIPLGRALASPRRARARR